MRVKIVPGATLRGEARVPGDKSIAHRQLILACTAKGTSRLAGLPASLDVAATATCLARITAAPRPSLETWVRQWIRQSSRKGQGNGFTWDLRDGGLAGTALEVQGEGRSGLIEPSGTLDCANSGTSMRLLAGLLASAPFAATLDGDESLRQRPMERVAEPLRAMGSTVRTVEGHPPVMIRGGELQGIRFVPSVPSAQVKSAVLLAGLDASGTTIVSEPIATRDHTERALAALGAPIRIDSADATGVVEVAIERFQHEGFEAAVPGDVSSAAFLVAAAALTRSELSIPGVGLNPSRTAYLHVMRRMGVRAEARAESEGLGEPAGELRVSLGGDLVGTEVSAQELPLVIDEVPVLAILAAQAAGDSRFAGAGELEVKESDRLHGIAEGILALGGQATVEGQDLVVAGGGLRGGRVRASGDHRMAMTFAVAGLSSRGPVEIDGIEAADVSFPGFVATLAHLGAEIQG